MEKEKNNVKGLRQNVLSVLRYGDSMVFKVLMFLATAFLVVAIMPENYSFKYDFNKGQAWKYEDLSAPFDFTLVKTSDQLREEKDIIRTSNRLYFRYSDTVNTSVLNRYDANTETAFPEEEDHNKVHNAIKIGKEALSYVMKKGVASEASSSVVRSKNEIVSLVYGADEKEVIFSELFSVKQAMEYISKRLRNAGVSESMADKILNVCEAVISPDVIYDGDMTDVALEEKLEGISPNYGFVAKGKHIISQDEPVSDYAFSVLTSLSAAYTTHQVHSWKVTLGYVLLIFTVFALLFWLLTVFKRGKYFHVKPIAMILANILVSFLMCYTVTRFSSSAIYMVPICMQTIVMRSFMNARVAFMSHLSTVFLCSFLAPNIYMYILVWSITGIACAFSNNEIYHRSKLFGSVGRMTTISIVVALGAMLVQNSANISAMLSICGYLVIAGVLMLFAQPIIYVYEKVFGLLSDISLLELTDTNSPLLRLLSQKAPGTFQHSLSVSNIAEQAAREMGANALLVRVGALYHDIGKLKNPAYFIENQGAHYNPHDDIDPKESSDIIRAHVTDGLDLAKKNGIPSIVSDFMRTHHGQSLVYYFYKKACEIYGVDGVDEKDYRYSYTKPVSKEEAILMICDSVEAASRSLKTITEDSIRSLVSSVVERQMKDGQFDNAEISFKEINRLKNILVEKLLEIYHSRIEYQKD